MPDVLLLAPCAIHPDPISAAYLDVCQAEIDRLGLGPNVTLVTEFLPDDEARTLLAASDVIALPYAETAESSSAALRFVLGIGAPVVTTDIRIFADAADVLLRPPRTRRRRSPKPSSRCCARRAGPASWRPPRSTAPPSSPGHRSRRST